MNCIKNYIIPSIILMLSLVLPHLFKAAPVAQLWRGYTVVRVPAADAAVLPPILEQNGCADVIRLENQHPPLESDSGAPIAPAFFSEEDDYLVARRAYFFDKSGRFQLMYVPVRYARQAAAVLNELSAVHGITGALIGRTEYSWFCPLVCILFAAALTLLAADKTRFVLAAAAPAFYPIALPLAAPSAGVCLLLCGIFAAHGVARNECDRPHRKKRALPIFAAAALPCAFTGGLKAGLLLTLALCGAAAGALLHAKIQEALNEQYSFRPVRILTAALSEQAVDKRLIALPLTSCAAGILLGSVLLAPRATPFDKSIGGFFVPAPGGESGTLPGLSDYIHWRWRALTAPYAPFDGTHLDSVPADGERIVFPRYALSDGVIRASSDVFVFDDAFRAASLSALDALPYPAVEKLLKAQGEAAQFGYSSASFQSVTLLTIIPLAAACFIPLFFAAAGWYGAFKNRYKV